MEFPRAGVKAWFLLGEFWEAVSKDIDDLPQWTTARVLQEYIKAKTPGCSYCDMLQQQGHSAFGESANVFISHVHGYLFVDLLNALEWKLQDEPETVIWMDMFSINQHQPVNWTFDWLSNTFRSSIQGMGRTIMVMSPWDNPQPFTRAWCVFEAYCTTVTNSEYEIALSQTDESKFLQDIVKDEAAVWIECRRGINQTLHGENHQATFFAQSHLAALRFSQQLFADAATLYGATYK